MEKVLKGLQWRTLLLYLDDVIIFSKDFESHLERLAEVCQRFRSAQLKLRPEKCHLSRERSITWDTWSVGMVLPPTRLR